MLAARSVTPLVLAASLAVPLVTGPAHAAPPERERFREVIDEPLEPFELCGIPVTGEVRARLTFTLFLRDGEVVGDRVTGRTRTTFRAADGRSLVLSSSGLTTSTVTENADGTLSILATVKGQAEKLKAAGRPLSMDRGLITIASTIDFNDPEDETDDVFTDVVLLQRGPHPAADSGFTSFCRAVESALG